VIESGSGMVVKILAEHDGNERIDKMPTIPEWDTRGFSNQTFIKYSDHSLIRTRGFFFHLERNSIFHSPFFQQISALKVATQCLCMFI
jgi:hypothetical protein